MSTEDIIGLLEGKIATFTRWRILVTDSSKMDRAIEAYKKAAAILKETRQET